MVSVPSPLLPPLPSLPRFVVVCGDGEYIIYTAMALRNKSFGSAQEFVWAGDSNEYAVRENSSSIKVFKNFKETRSFKPDLGAEGGQDVHTHTHLHTHTRTHLHTHTKV